MRLGCHQNNDPTGGRSLALPENQRECPPEPLRPSSDTDNACSLGLHFRWLDGSLESYISKWLDTDRKECAPGKRTVMSSELTFLGSLGPRPRSMVLTGCLTCLLVTLHGLASIAAGRNDENAVQEEYAKAVEH